MKTMNERIAEYRARIDLDLAVIRDAKTWAIARYPESTVVNLQGEPIHKSLPPDAQQLLTDLDEHELMVKKLVAESLGLTLDQAESGE